MPALKGQGPGAQIQLPKLHVAYQRRAQQYASAGVCPQQLQGALHEGDRLARACMGVIWI